MVVHDIGSGDVDCILQSGQGCQGLATVTDAITRGARALRFTVSD